MGWASGVSLESVPHVKCRLFIHVFFLCHLHFLFQVGRSSRIPNSHSTLNPSFTLHSHCNIGSEMLNSHGGKMKKA
ncbi:hypothetical protein LZ31DRAFT_127406 [Colletotrichum somersetense]|nr:hypothetical protein LZ31DRAFT_127406 [Colletotrichum somersetense]